VQQKPVQQAPLKQKNAQMIELLKQERGKKLINRENQKKMYEYILANI
jgi:hypothetical protein